MSVRQQSRLWSLVRATRRALSRASQVVELLGIGHLLDRRPANLSGGEKQRVAIGRALLANPRLLLMDEPLASLDEERKAEILPYLERLRDETEIPIVYVSHSVAEVARLATDVVSARRRQGRCRAADRRHPAAARPDAGRTNAPRSARVLDLVVDGHDEALRDDRAAVGRRREPRAADDAGVGARVTSAHPRSRRHGGHRKAARPQCAQRACRPHRRHWPADRWSKSASIAAARRSCRG